MRLSVSMKPTPSRFATRRPTLVLPDPIGPTSTSVNGSGLLIVCDQRGFRCGGRAQLVGDRGQIALEVAPGLADAVAAELLKNRSCELDRDHRLGHDARCRYGAHIRTLMVGAG